MRVALGALLLIILLWAASSAQASNNSGTAADRTPTVTAADSNGANTAAQPAVSATASASLGGTADVTLATPESGAGAAGTSTSAASASANPEPDPVPQAVTEQAPLSPAAATSGTVGLFTLDTGQTLPQGGWSSSFSANKFERMPGSVTVLQYGLTVGYGISDRLNVYAEFDPDEHLHVDAPGELSFNTAKTQPPFDHTIYRVLPVGERPGYVQDYPFAASRGGGTGPVAVGLKFGLLEESKGAPLSLAVRNDFLIPTAITFDDVITNQVGNGEFNDRIVLAASKTWPRIIEVTVNAGVFLTPAPKVSGRVVLQQAQQFLVGGGFALFPERRVQIINEYNGTIFFGNRTPDNSFGAEDPMEGIWGVRLYPLRQVYIDAGYRYMLNLTNADSIDRSGFVIKVGTGVIPFGR